MTKEVWFGCVVTFLFGISIGSFMNVVIWRLPRNGSLVEPQWSYCPSCHHRLMGGDLIPLLSYLLCVRKCRYCKKPISSRYFWVELLTGVLFVVLYLRFQPDMVNVAALTLFGALLVPIYCIDLELFEIPNQLNLLIFIIAVGRDVYGIATHQPGHALAWNWMPQSILGALAGIAIFGSVRLIGWLWKRVEAMGLGDVLLARAMGAMLVSVVPVGANPLRLIPIWVMLSIGSGAIVGPALIFARQRKQNKEGADRPVAVGVNETIETADDSDSSSLGRELRDILYVIWLEDAVEYVRYVLSRPATVTPGADTEVEDAWQPAASAIPFGPFMVVGFVAALLVGEHLTAMYLAYAWPRAAVPGYLY